MDSKMTELASWRKGLRKYVSCVHKKGEVEIVGGKADCKLRSTASALTKHLRSGSANEKCWWFKQTHNTQRALLESWIFLKTVIFVQIRAFKFKKRVGYTGAVRSMNRALASYRRSMKACDSYIYLIILIMLSLTAIGLMHELLSYYLIILIMLSLTAIDFLHELLSYYNGLTVIGLIALNQVLRGSVPAADRLLKRSLSAQVLSHPTVLIRFMRLMKPQPSQGLFEFMRVY